MDAIIVGKDGKWYSSKVAKLDASGNVVAKHDYKRYRATVVIFRDNKVLLVKDKGRDDYSMPGGGFKKGESTIQAGIREVTKEELGGLTVLSAERLRQCDFEGRRAKHKVVELVTEGTPYIKGKHELDEVIWWDMKSKINAQGHVYYILNKLGKL